MNFLHCTESFKHDDIKKTLYTDEYHAAHPLSRCCWRSVHDGGGMFGLPKILAMLMSHCATVGLCPLNSCYICVVFGTFRSLLVYFVKANYYFGPFWFTDIQTHPRQTTMCTL